MVCICSFHSVTNALDPDFFIKESTAVRLLRLELVTIGMEPGHMVLALLSRILTLIYESLSLLTFVTWQVESEDTNLLY